MCTLYDAQYRPPIAGLTPHFCAVLDAASSAFLAPIFRCGTRPCSRTCCSAAALLKPTWQARPAGEGQHAAGR